MIIKETNWYESPINKLPEIQCYKVKKYPTDGNRFDYVGDYNIDLLGKSDFLYLKS
jgi:hypothetical protein